MPEEARLEQNHIPVLAREVLDMLAPKKRESYLDLTAGFGGHAKQVLDITENANESTLVDRDSVAISYLHKIFKGTEIIHVDFSGACKNLIQQGKQYDLILADLGVSSVHLNDKARGFSFQSDAPLDMRMDVSQQLTAYAVVNHYSEKQLRQILSEYGEEPKAVKIARLIVENRPIKSTLQLADVVLKARHGWSKIHPATRTFQAVRIEVNQELKQIEETLPLVLNLLNPGGRVAVISFHSLEDRLIKRFFSEHSTGYGAELENLTRHPITASQTEVAFNPRARSAKLRAAVKIKTRAYKRAS